MKNSKHNKKNKKTNNNGKSKNNLNTKNLLRKNKTLSKNKKSKLKIKFKQQGGNNELSIQNQGGGKFNDFRAIDIILLIALILLGGLGYLLLQSSKIFTPQQQEPIPHVSSGVVINPSLHGHGIHISSDMDHPNQVYRHAQRRLEDPLLPPERSNPRMSPYSVDVSKLGIPINVPTRGENGPYQQIGYLQDSDEKILPLFGKQVYPGSHKWNYYTSTDQYHQVKIPIMHNNKNCTNEYGCDEISSGDSMKVPSYPNRQFTASIYQLDAPRYIPY